MRIYFCRSVLVKRNIAQWKKVNYITRTFFTVAVAHVRCGSTFWSYNLQYVTILCRWCRQFSPSAQGNHSDKASIYRAEGTFTANILLPIRLLLSSSSKIFALHPFFLAKGLWRSYMVKSTIITKEIYEFLAKTCSKCKVF